MRGNGPPARPGDAARAGLCASCRHARVVTNRQGSRFWLCERSLREPEYPKYPPLPVIACPGWDRAGRDGGATHERQGGGG